MKLITAAILLLGIPPLLGHADNLNAFPKASAGMTQFVLQLPPMADENDYKVELIVGKTLSLEPRNQYRLNGKMSAETLQGWGYTYYAVSSVNDLISTRMAIDPNAPKVSRFITLGGEAYLVRYNSRLPIVVYAPQDTEVRYRLWQADKKHLPLTIK